MRGKIGPMARFAPFLVLLALLPAACEGERPPERLRVRVAAALEEPARAAADDFRAATGIEFELSAAGSQELAAELAEPDAADLYLFDDEEFAFDARNAGDAREVIHIAQLRPVLCVPAGSPHAEFELFDLEREELRVGIPDPETCGLGLHVRTALRYIGAWHHVRQTADLVARTEPELLDALASGELDVAVLWDATVRRDERVERIVELKLEGHVRRATIAVRAHPHHARDALAFARWLRSSDRGRPRWEEAAVTVLPGGDPFALRPEATLFVASRWREAVEPPLVAWSEREGADLELVAGSDAELAARAATERPTGLLLYDDRRLARAGDAYRDAEHVSSDPLALVVYGMNPEGVASLEDLALPGLSVALLARESGDRATLAWEALEAAGVADAVAASPGLVVGDDAGALTEAVRAKELDAVLLHGTLAVPPTMQSDVIRLRHPRFELHQVFALRDEQDLPELAQRMRDALRHPGTHERFFHLGYRWQSRNEEPLER